MRVSIPIAELPTSSAFLRDYTRPEEYSRRIANWFPYSPHSALSFDERLTELDGVEAAAGRHRAVIASALAVQQERWGADSLARANCAALSHQGVYAVVTGQQTGLFGGPLYTQLKALTCVKLARELAERFPGRQFVPMFWMASGDPDFEEIRRSWILDGGGAVNELSLPMESPSELGLVASARRVGPGLAEALLHVEHSLPGGEFRDDIVRSLQEDYGAAASGEPGGMVVGFARWMARLSRGTGLVIVDPQDAMLMGSASELLQFALANQTQIAQALEHRNLSIREAGFPLQVEGQPEDTHLFLLDDEGRRRKLSLDAQGFTLAGSEERYSLAQVQQLAHSEPERFVCGVMLRPLYQNILVPPIAFVGGGAEIAYRAQTTAVFDACAPACHGLKMAPAIHRASATLLPSRSAELLDELGWELLDCLVPSQELADRAALALRPQEIEQALSAYVSESNAAEMRLKALAVALDPSLAEPFDTLHQNFLKHSEKLEKKITSSIKQRSEGLQRRVVLVSSQCWPKQNLQERVLSALGFLPRYGFGLMETLLERISTNGREHQVIVL